MLRISVVLIMTASVGFGSEVKIGIRSPERVNSTHPVFSQRIVNGSPVEEGELPYQVSIQVKGKNQHNCGGAIIKDNVILTAAHCIYPYFIPRNLQVVTGLVSLSHPGPNSQTVDVKRVDYHPSYLGVMTPNDIGLLILKSPLKFTNYVRPIALPPKDEQYTGDVLVSGWGSISDTDVPVYPDRMQKVVAPLIPFQECLKVWPGYKLNEVSHICTGPIGGSVSPCLGDSGGPLVKDVNGTKVVVGVISWGQIPCGRGAPSVYTRISSYIDYINDNFS